MTLSVFNWTFKLNISRAPLAAFTGSARTVLSLQLCGQAQQLDSTGRVNQGSGAGGDSAGSAQLAGTYAEPKGQASSPPPLTGNSAGPHTD